MSAKKFHVVIVNNDCSVQILYTTPHLNDCHLFMAEYISEKMNIDGRFSKAYHDNENTISIYNYHYILPKSLRCKICVIEYCEGI